MAPARHFHFLFRVQLDDKLLFEVLRDLSALRVTDKFAFKECWIELDPGILAS
jgi:hypothetical protein